MSRTQIIFYGRARRPYIIKMKTTRVRPENRYRPWPPETRSLWPKPRSPQLYGGGGGGCGGAARTYVHHLDDSRAAGGPSARAFGAGTFGCAVFVSLFVGSPARTFYANRLILLYRSTHIHTGWFFFLLYRVPARLSVIRRFSVLLISVPFSVVIKSSIDRHFTLVPRTP